MICSCISSHYALRSPHFFGAFSLDMIFTNVYATCFDFVLVIFYIVLKIWQTNIWHDVLYCRYGNTCVCSFVHLIRPIGITAVLAKQGILCNIEGIVWYISTYVMLCMNKMFNSIFGNIMIRPENLPCSSYTEWKTTTCVRFPLFKVLLAYIQNIISSFQVYLVLCTPYCWIT